LDFRPLGHHCILIIISLTTQLIERLKNLLFTHRSMHLKHIVGIDVVVISFNF